VECIYQLTVDDEKYDKFGKMLFIHPDECIDCAACEPACPWEAIFEESAVPDVFQEEIEMNREIFEDHSGDELTTDCTPIKQAPTPEEVAENKKKHGYE
jgi:Fe-S-cluster-containing hydrogenase component 2